jgi:hypothetical protein
MQADLNVQFSTVARGRASHQESGRSEINPLGPIVSGKATRYHHESMPIGFSTKMETQ